MVNVFAVSRMTEQEFATLAYAKSPKTSRRTTFQDELQVAVSARASKTKTELYSDDFHDDEDDFFNKFLTSRKKKTDAFKAGKSRAKINHFDLSDDEGKHQRTKKVSFLKTQRVSFPSEDAAESFKNKPPDSPVSGHNNNHSVSLQNSTNNSKHDTIDPQILRESSGKSLSRQTSDDTLLDLPLSSPSDSRVAETPGPEEKTPHLSDPDLKDAHPAEREPPRPKPRQRTQGLSRHNAEKLPEEIEKDVSRPQTSAASIPLSNDASSTTTWTEDSHSVLHSPSKSSSSQSELSHLLTKSTVDSGSIAGLISDDSKEQERKYSTSFEEFNENMGDSLDCSVAQLTHTHEKSTDTRTSSSHSKATHRSQSVCHRKVESKYLGTLKLLDHKVSLNETQPQVANSIRAAVYQEWLNKKMKKSREKMQLKKREEILQEKKKKDEEAAKKEDAAASYEAWKEKKRGNLKEKAKEKEDMMRKEQQASEEKEEKRHSAKQVFEKWKKENDHLLQENYRKKKEAENNLKLKKQQNEEERRRESVSAYSKWCEKKKDVLHEKATKEHREIENKEEEDRYMKEEKEKMALEVYEKWLARKDLEHKRQREERQIKEILRDSPPPPWSPPNKTVGFRK